MKETRINLSELYAHGKTKTEVRDGELTLWSTHSCTSYAFNLYGDSFKRHYIMLPGKYRLPLRIEMRVRLDAPLFILLVGEGHISFNTPWQDNRRIEDIVKPSGKPNQGDSFDNRLPQGRFADIAVTYNRDAMQICIDGEERLYTRKMPYMRLAQNGDGYAIRLVAPKLSALRIQSIRVMEFSAEAPIMRGDFVGADIIRPPESKPTFGTVIATLPETIRHELQKTDNFLKSLRPLKCKRAVDKNGGKISYVASDFGISYVFNISGEQSVQHFGWYLITAGKAETWHVKNDCMEETLMAIAEVDPALAERIFDALNDCTGCYSPNCLAKRLYMFAGQKRVACHGRVMFGASPADFEAARAFFRYLNQRAIMSP